MCVKRIYVLLQVCPANDIANETARQAVRERITGAAAAAAGNAVATDEYHKDSLARHFRTVAEAVLDLDGHVLSDEERDQLNRFLVRP